MYLLIKLGVRTRPTARLLGRARQLHQLKTDTRLESALKEARDDDDVLVERFTQTAYQALGAAVLHEPSVVAPLAALPDPARIRAHAQRRKRRRRGRGRSARCCAIG